MLFIIHYRNAKLGKKTQKRSFEQTLFSFSIFYRKTFPSFLLSFTETAYQKNATVWYSQYHTVVFTVPHRGIHSTTPWYSQYHTVVFTVPRRGIRGTTPWYSHHISMATPPPGARRTVTLPSAGMVTVVFS